MIDKRKICDFIDRQRLNLEIQIFKNTYHNNIIKYIKLVKLQI